LGLLLYAAVLSAFVAALVMAVASLMEDWQWSKQRNR
jgi:hypothetical protein